MSQIIRKVARPDLIRAAVATVVSIAALVVAYSSLHQQHLIQAFRDGDAETSDWIALVAALVFVVAGWIAVRRVNAGLSKALEQRLGDARGAPIGLVFQIVGSILMLLMILDLVGVNLGGLLLGGAITGVVVGIAAQQTLANLFAGIVLLFVRPFTVGEHIVLRSGPLGGEYDGRVTDIGLFYVDLMTEYGSVKLPNAGVLAGAVGPGARQPKEGPDEEETAAPPAEGGAPRA